MATPKTAKNKAILEPVKEKATSKPSKFKCICGYERPHPGKKNTSCWKCQRPLNFGKNKQIK